MFVTFRRITSRGNFIPEIDGLRFIAIASVVLYHFWGFVAAAAPSTAGDVVGFWATHGYRGVNLFYVISGFILGLPFAAHHLKARPAVSLPRYFLRRLTRLEPPYILNLLICFFVFQAASLPHFWASALYIHNLWFGQQSPINPVAWTLEVEVQFYCLAPLLSCVFALGSRFRRRALLLACIAAAGLLQLWFWDAGPRVKLSILYAIQFFLAGFLLADIYLSEWNEHPRSHWLWDLAALLCWPAIFMPADRQIWLFLPFLMLVACISAFRAVIVLQFFRNSAVTAVGGMCYTIYLFHYVLIPPLLQFTAGLRPDDGFNERFIFRLLLYLPLLAAVSCAYFLLIERPCMKKDWPQRLLRWIRSRRPNAALMTAAAAVGLAGACITINVRGNYDGNLSGLFYTGRNAALPASLHGHTRRADDVKGYDAQYYHLIARSADDGRIGPVSGQPAAPLAPDRSTRAGGPLFSRRRPVY